MDVTAGRKITDDVLIVYWWVREFSLGFERPKKIFIAVGYSKVANATSATFFLPPLLVVLHCYISQCDVNRFSPALHTPRQFITGGLEEWLLVLVPFRVITFASQ